MRSPDGFPSPSVESRPSKRLRLENTQDEIYLPQVVKDFEEKESTSINTLDRLTSKKAAFSPPSEAEVSSRTPNTSSDWDVDHNGGSNNDLDVLFPTIAEPKVYSIFDEYESTTVNGIAENQEQSHELAPLSLTKRESSHYTSPGSTLTSYPNGIDKFLWEDITIRQNDELELEEDNTKEKLTGIRDAPQNEIVCFGMVKLQSET